MIGLFAVGLSLLGLAVDMARAFAERASLRAQADSAALAAASGLLDEELALNAIVLSPEDAARRARALARRAGLDPSAELEVSVERDHVRIRVTRRIDTLFLKLVGISEMSIGATATASPRPSA